MNQVRWAVLGAGGIARRRTIPEGIVPADNAVLVAVCDLVDGAAIAEQYGAIHCKTYNQLLDQDIDAVYVATPTFLHHDQVLKAARAGKHVLCEKPLSTDIDKAQKMVEACEDAGVKFGVGMMMRYHAHHMAAQRLIREGAIGKPVLGRAQLSCWYPPIDGAWRQDSARSGGGCLADLGVHCIDLLEMLLGRVSQVVAMTGRVVHQYDVEDTATVLLEFNSGARGIVDCYFNVPDSSSLNRLELYGSGGSILADGTIGQDGSGVMIMRAENSTEDYQANQYRDQQGGTLIDPINNNLYRSQIEGISRAIIEGVEVNVSGRDGLWNQRVLAACYKSATSGGGVAI